MIMRFFGKALIALFATLGVLAVGLAGVGLLALSSLGRQAEPLPESMVLTLAIDGAFPETGGDDPSQALMAGLLGERPRPSLLAVSQALTQAATDPAVRGVLVHVGEAGLGMAQAQEVRDAVRAFRASGKPALVFAETLGEFGGGTVPYYVASAFDQVWLQPSGLVAATGFAVRQPFARALLDRLGLEAQFETRKSFKTAASALTDPALSEPGRVALSAVVEGWMGQVVQGVAADRSLAPAQVRALIDRAPLLAQEAKEAGLVDRLGYADEVETAITQAAGTTQRVPLARYAADLARRTPDKEARRVIYLSASGPVVLGDGRQGPFDDQEIDGRALAAAIDKAVQDPKAVGIVLRLNSPGGSYVGSDVVWRAIARARDRGMPIIASLGDMAASGGYFIAMGANRIVAQPGTLTGSIGVLAGKVTFGKASADLGVTWDGVSAGRNAGLFSPTEPFDEAGRARLGAVLDAIYADFTAKAARARSLSPVALEAAAQGRVWIGADARTQGLVDDLGGVAQALAAVRSAAGLDPTTPLDIVRGGTGEDLPWLLRAASHFEGAHAVAALMRGVATVVPLLEGVEGVRAPLALPPLLIE
ncbi:S49 family peptidase [Pararhodospirillum photometricum]|uniref:Peptidase S49 n=1 Tax=Pararhodospirillum photometricum DSM 122 TaxID=1150469 RepID=H6SIQ5_PARPM|nr:S49 family peptidase [Pararhodospirillum photometricum]CCG06682.1 Peptidase S49 [Pararhodospirillum photometricum DSM 122]